jgi:diadenosine tetraphosphate (Ap4A) HIT family hydrolase
MPDCLFCRIIRKEVPAEIVYEDEATLAFLDIHPTNPGHTLVVPKQHSDGLPDADPTVLGHVIQAVQRVANALMPALGIEGFNIIQNNGSVAGQVIPYPHFLFPSGARISFRHLNQENDVLGWQGSQIPFIGYDELTHYSAFQFWYMFSRLRSTSGVRPYIRATTNPDAESWVADLLEWWIDQDSGSPTYGLPIPERSGVIRYFARINNELMWADSIEDLVSRHGCDYLDAKSFTFIPAKITDNPILMKKDPAYLANLKALTRVERARLLDGNWKVRPKAGDYFPRDAITVILSSQIYSAN